MFNDEKRFCLHANKGCSRVQRVDLGEQNLPDCIYPHPTCPTPVEECHKIENFLTSLAIVNEMLNSSFYVQNLFSTSIDVIPGTEKSVSVLAVSCSARMLPILTNMPY